MPENEYIRYRHTLIRNDRIGVSLYLKFFHEHISNRKIIPPFLRRPLNVVKVFFLKLIFLLKHIVLKRDLILIKGDFLIKREGAGKIKSDTFLVTEGGSLRIRREIESEDFFNVYKEYYERYHNNASRVCLPLAVFDASARSITTDFIQAPKLLNLFYDKHYGFDGVINVYKDICEQLDVLHGEESVGIVHGDLTVVNILVDKNKFFLIDYLDSFVYKIKYDKYLLIRSIFKFFGQEISFQSLREYLSLDEVEFNEFEEVYQQRREMK